MERLASARVLCIADSDSFLKWGAHLASHFVAASESAPWEPGKTRLVVLRSNATPSRRQIERALVGTRFRAEDVEIVDHDGILELSERFLPDVLLAAARGFVVSAVVDLLVPRGAVERPVILTGLPGISYPALAPGIRYRARADLFVLHSRREVSAYEQLAQRIGARVRFTLARLPFLAEPGEREAVPRPEHGSVVFATQAKVPRLRSQRRAILETLIRTAELHPEREVVVKVRTAEGEVQTHREAHAYPDLLAQIGDERELPPNLVVRGDAMADELDRALILVTVSSTALIEAIDRRVGVIAIDDFGVSRGLINSVLKGSGLLAPMSIVERLEVRQPTADWLEQNYFHDPSANTVAREVEELLALRASRGLPDAAGYGRGPVWWLRHRYYRHQAFVPEQPSFGYRAADRAWRMLLWLSDVRGTVRSWVRRGA